MLNCRICSGVGYIGICKEHGEEVIFHSYYDNGEVLEAECGKCYAEGNKNNIHITKHICKICEGKGKLDRTNPFYRRMKILNGTSKKDFQLTKYLLFEV